MTRRIVQKPLDEGCLLDGELHPSIRLRLERLRELPMTAVANLHGVERIDGQAMLIWQFVEGRTLEEVVADSDAETREKLKRDLTLVVEQLHGFGIVHGSLHGRNIFVDARGRVILTHFSPLLHNDPAVDFEAIEGIFAGASLSSANEPAMPAAAESSGIRARAIAGAAAALIAGLGIAVSIIWYFAMHA